MISQYDKSNAMATNIHPSAVFGDSGPMASERNRGFNVKNRQQQLVDAGYDIGRTGVDGVWGDKSSGAWDQYQADKRAQTMQNIKGGLGAGLNIGKKTLGAIGGGAVGVGGLLLKGMDSIGGGMQSDVQNQLTKQNTLSDGTVLGRGDAGYAPLSDMQRMKSSVGGTLKGVGSAGMNIGGALNNAFAGNWGGAGQNALAAGKSALGGFGSALGGLSAGASMLGKALQGVNYGARY